MGLIAIQQFVRDISPVIGQLARFLISTNHKTNIMSDYVSTLALLLAGCNRSHMGSFFNHVHSCHYKESVNLTQAINMSILILLIHDLPRPRLFTPKHQCSFYFSQVVQQYQLQINI